MLAPDSVDASPYPPSLTGRCRQQTAMRGFATVAGAMPQESRHNGRSGAAGSGLPCWSWSRCLLFLFCRVAIVLVAFAFSSVCFSLVNKRAWCSVRGHTVLRRGIEASSRRHNMPAQARSRVVTRLRELSGPEIWTCRPYAHFGTWPDELELQNQRGGPLTGRCGTFVRHLSLRIVLKHAPS